jgi:fructose-1,6-bisphosphatase
VGWLLQGSNLVAAGYCLYSSSMHLVFTLGNGVVGFTYDQQVTTPSPSSFLSF